MWSGREDSNLRPPAPKAGALPSCATPRPAHPKRSLHSGGIITLCLLNPRLKRAPSEPRLRQPSCPAWVNGSTDDAARRSSRGSPPSAATGAPTSSSSRPRSCSTGRSSSSAGRPPSSCSPTTARPRSARPSARGGAGPTPSTSASPRTRSCSRTRGPSGASAGSTSSWTRRT